MVSKDASRRVLHARNATTRRLPVLAQFGLVLGLVVPQFAWAAAPAAAPATTSQKAGPAAAATPGDKPASSSQLLAVVNGEQIGRSALAQDCLARYGREVLDALLNRWVIQQACQARGITITDKEVQDEIRSIATKFNLSIENWLALLETERNVDAEQYRRDIIWPALALRKLSASQITVTPQEYQEAFESEYGPKVRARLISVSSRQKAEQLLALAKAKPDTFPQLAKEHSEDKASASAYGVIPPIRMHLGDPKLEQTAFALQEGQVSPIVQVGNQYLLLLCEKQIERTLLTSQQMPVIEKQLKERIHDHKLRAQSATIFQQLQSQAKVVKVYKDPQQEAQYPGTAAVINQQPITLQQLSEECLARHGKDVLEGEINRRLLTQELRRQNKQVQQQDLEREILRAADAYGYTKPDGSPNTDAWLKAVTDGEDASIDLYVRDAVWPSVALKKLIGDSVQITNEDLKKGFESNFGERVEVLAIVMSNQRQAQTVWDMARTNPTDQFFGELAHQYSIEPASQANYGKVPPIRMHSGQPVVEKEAFRLKTGELSGILAVGDKFIVLRCLGRTQPIVKDFNLVKDELQKDLHEKKLRLEMAKRFERLKQDAQIDNFLAGTSQTGKTNAASKTPTASQATFLQPIGKPATAVKR